MLQTPIWITNFKNEEAAIGSRALELAKIHEKVAKETGAQIGVAVSPVDLYRISQEVSIPVFAQHVDAIDYGKHSGFILPQAVKKAGAVGTLLNHSEHRTDPEILKNTVSCAQKASLIRIVCAENPEEVEQYAEFDPDMLAFEPPELIGSTTASVATDNPKSIAESVKVSRGIPVLVGAGINSKEDVRVSLDLGAQGFLVATAIVKAPDPEQALRDFVSAF
ncbi:MAG: triose-phosphate isomerase [Candidatus Peregrinibacteria bacterium]|nr:triose-phosphate isomerase [Candidatus Peregrinibacteria bacterium]